MTYVNCPVCQKETSPIKIGGSVYCSVCGTPQNKTAIAPKRLSLDLSPRKRSAPVDPATSKPTATAPGAQSLHRRVKPGRVLDLRSTSAPAPKPLTVIENSHPDPATPPSSTARERHLAHYSDRLDQAKKISRSQAINKFGGEQRLTPIVEPEITAPITPGVAPPETGPELPQLAVTHHKAMASLIERLPKEDPAPHVPSSSRSWRPHLDLSPGHNRVAATVAAVAIMSGYIWFQNYPKFALQGADNKAGVAATMPGYLPSSYSLAQTNTSPGLVTLNFSSPSSNTPLKIVQHSTTWDSSSLLDNFVAKNSDDYSSVQSQGLTIYLFANNRATWVNKGIWFSIEGADRLSREQILKLAYSL
jgi:hypothetical protein